MRLFHRWELWLTYSGAILRERRRAGCGQRDDRRVQAAHRPVQELYSRVLPGRIQNDLSVGIRWLREILRKTLSVTLRCNDRKQPRVTDILTYIYGPILKKYEHESTIFKVTHFSEQLKKNYISGHYQLDVSLNHLKIYNEEAALKLRNHPGKFLPAVSKIVNSINHVIFCKCKLVSAFVAFFRTFQFHIWFYISLREN